MPRTSCLRQEDGMFDEVALVCLELTEIAAPASVLQYWD